MQPNRIRRIEKRQLTTLLGALYLLLTPILAWGGDSRPEPVRIFWDVKSGKNVDEAKLASFQKAWSKICAMLTQSMTAGKGPYGTGIFQGGSCYYRSQLISGTREDGSWLLVFSDEDSQASFRMYKVQDGKMYQYSAIRLPASDRTVATLLDPYLLDLLAYRIALDLPYEGWASQTVLKSEVFPIRGFKQSRTQQADAFPFPPPQEIELLDFNWDRKVRKYNYTRLGAGKLTTNEAGSSYSGYALDVEVLSAREGEGSWFAANSPDDRHTVLVQEILEKAYKDRLASIGGALLDPEVAAEEQSADPPATSTGTGYSLGLRLGSQILSGVALLENSLLLGLQFDVRSGAAKGLRYYFDYFPQTSYAETGSGGETFDTALTWMRHYLAYNIVLETAGFIDAITLEPKLGIWTFDGVLVSNVNDQDLATETASFKLGSTVSIGIEAALEFYLKSLSSRLWYSFDTGLSFADAGGSVTSNRSGVDIDVPVGDERSQIRYGILGYASIETVSVQNGDAPQIDGTGGDLAGINYNQAFLGLGLRVSF